VKLQKVASLFDILDKICDPLKVAVSEQPLSMEQSGQVGTCPSIIISGSFSITEVVCISMVMFLLFQMFGFLLYFSEYQGIGPYNILSIPKVLTPIISLVGMNLSSLLLRCKLCCRYMTEPRFLCPAHLMVSEIEDMLELLRDGLINPFRYQA
jgi:hypothetical protein